MIHKKRMVIYICSVIFTAVVLFFLREFVANYLVKLNLTDIEVPNKNDRVLIFAPHNDDEVLGAGELIKKSIKNGAKARVVFMTNGDGFKEAVEFDYFNLRPKPMDYIKFGYTRQKESIDALKLLGISEDNITFLGYPDGGLAYMWGINWDKNNPYVSKNTQISKSPYTNNYTKNAVYSGESVVEDITRILNEYKPTYIVFPHPNDRHPDHWATNAFIKYVLATIQYVPNKQLLYLVHRGDWPTPMKGEPNMYLVPPAKLIGIDTQWYSLSLNSDDEKEKEKAIHLYKTQIKALGPLLVAFERKNELFGEYDNFKVPKFSRESGSITVDFNNKIITDPLQDAIKLEISKSEDISAIYMEKDKYKNLNVFMKMNGEVEDDIAYNFNFILFYGNYNKRLNLKALNNKVISEHVSGQSIMNTKGVEINIKGDVIHMIIPYSIVQDFKYIFVNGYTSIGDKMIDKTSWRMGE